MLYFCLCHVLYSWKRLKRKLDRKLVCVGSHKLTFRSLSPPAPLQMAGPNVFYLFRKKKCLENFFGKKIGLAIPKVQKLNRCLTCELSFDSSPVCYHNYANVFMHNR